MAVQVVKPTTSQPVYQNSPAGLGLAKQSSFSRIPSGNTSRMEQSRNSKGKDPANRLSLAYDYIRQNESSDSLFEDSPMPPSARKGPRGSYAGLHNLSPDQKNRDSSFALPASSSQRNMIDPSPNKPSGANFQGAKILPNTMDSPMVNPKVMKSSKTFTLGLQKAEGPETSRSKPLESTAVESSSRMLTTTRESAQGKVILPIIKTRR